MVDVSGNFLLQVAREAMRQYLKHRKVIEKPPRYPPELDAPGGAVIELYKRIPVSTLKSSAAILNFERPLIDNTVQCAITAAEELKLDELPVVQIELSVIPELIELKGEDLKDYVRQIEPGRHGLYIKKGVLHGILMPRIPVERKWTICECLENLCLKAGLLKDSWADPAVKIYRFEPRTFKERIV